MNDYEGLSALFDVSSSDFYSAVDFAISSIDLASAKNVATSSQATMDSGNLILDTVDKFKAEDSLDLESDHLATCTKGINSGTNCLNASLSWNLVSQNLSGPFSVGLNSVDSGRTGGNGLVNSIDGNVEEEANFLAEVQVFCRIDVYQEEDVMDSFEAERENLDDIIEVDALLEVEVVLDRVDDSEEGHCVLDAVDAGRVEDAEGDSFGEGFCADVTLVSDSAIVRCENNDGKALLSNVLEAGPVVSTLRRLLDSSFLSILIFTRSHTKQTSHILRKSSYTTLQGLGDLHGLIFGTHVPHVWSLILTDCELPIVVICRPRPPLSQPLSGTRHWRKLYPVRRRRAELSVAFHWTE